MNQKFLIVAISCIVLFVNVSCRKSWYDAKSDKTLTVPTSIQDFEYLLDDYSTMNINTPALGEVGSDDHILNDKIWTTYSTSFYYPERNASVWSNVFPYLGVRDWNLTYKRIFRCNLVIDGLRKITPTDGNQNQFNRVLGNAFFHRAKNYYDLAQLYAQPYVQASAGTDLGLAIQEGTDVTKKVNRTSVQETYDQIIFDLKSAASLLPEKPVYLTRGSKVSAYAMLARVYLAMQDYNDAAKYADSALNLNNKLLDYNTLSVSLSTIGQFNSEVLFHSQMINYYSSSPLYGYSFIDTNLYKTYDINDLRKTRFFIKNSNGSVSFKGQYTQYGDLFSGIANDEIYLIRAECFARSGDVSNALTYLNSLLLKRWNKSVQYLPITAGNSDDALTKILIERKKELLQRGIRWCDLRRLNLDSRFAITISRKINGQIYSLIPNSFEYTLPIPQDEKSLSGIEQNPGW